MWNDGNWRSMSGGMKPQILRNSVRFRDSAKLRSNSPGFCSNSGLFTHLKSITQSAAILLTFEQFEQFEQFDSNSTIDIKLGTMVPTFLIEAPLRHHFGDCIYDNILLSYQQNQPTSFHSLWGTYWWKGILFDNDNEFFLVSYEMKWIDYFLIWEFEDHDETLITDDVSNVVIKFDKYWMYV